MNPLNLDGAARRCVNRTVRAVFVAAVVGVALGVLLFRVVVPPSASSPMPDLASYSAPMSPDPTAGTLEERLRAAFAEDFACPEAQARGVHIPRQRLQRVDGPYTDGALRIQWMVKQEHYDNGRPKALYESVQFDRLAILGIVRTSGIPLRRLELVGTVVVTDIGGVFANDEERDYVHALYDEAELSRLQSARWAWQSESWWIGPDAVLAIGDVTYPDCSP